MPRHFWIMFAFIMLIATIIITCCKACELDTKSDESIASAIFKAENSVKYPYGIKSIDTKGDVVYAKKICLNTIRNNRKRFLKQKEYTCFIEFLGSRYCPPKIHILNTNWVRNVKYHLKKGI